MIRASLSGLVAAVFSLFAYSYQEALGNPFGFGRERRAIRVAHGGRVVRSEAGVRVRSGNAR